MAPASAGLADAEALGGGPGHGDTEHLTPGDLLGPCGGVDHDTLPGSGGADQDREALRAGHGAQGLLLLEGQGCAYALGDLPARVCPGVVADVPAGRLGEHPGASLDRLLLSPDRERRHPPALQGQDPTLANHLAGQPDRLLGTQLPR